MKKLHVASTPLEDTANKIAKLMIDEEPYRWVYSDRAEVELIKGIRKLLNPLIPDAQEQTEIINKIRIEYIKVFHGNKTRAERENPEVIPHNQIADIVRRILQKKEFGTGYLERIRYQNFPEQKKAWISRIEGFINRCFGIFGIYQFLPEMAPEERNSLSPEEKLEKIIDSFHAIQIGENRVIQRYPQYENMAFYQQFIQEARDLLRDIMIYHGMSGENFKTYFSGQPAGAAFVEILSFYQEIKEAKTEEDFPGGLLRYSTKRIKSFSSLGL